MINIVKLTIGLLFFASTVTAKEPIIGGPCQGCELVFIGMPNTLNSHGKIADNAEPGEKLIVTGTVYNLDNTPAANVIVYAYQTNAQGKYPKGKTNHGKLRGWAKSDIQGKYSFETIRPVAYPGANEPQHIHLHIIERNKGTYYIDDVTFADDPLLAKQRKPAKCRGGCGTSHAKIDQNNIWHIQRDITLGAAIPNYHFTTKNNRHLD